MGSGSGWHCRKCGAEEEYWTGYGEASCNVSETRERIARGDLGEIAKALLSNDFPLEVNIIDETVFYRCCSCEALVEGMNVRFFARGGSQDLVLHVPPEKCPECGTEFFGVDECTPVSDGELFARVERIIRDGCPECGSKDIEPVLTRWD